MDALEVVKLTGSAVGGAGVALLGLYRFFVPRDECKRRHDSIVQLGVTVETQRDRQGKLEGAFIALRRDVRWGIALQSAVAKHLNIPVPEQPQSED